MTSFEPGSAGVPSNTLPTLPQLLPRSRIEVESIIFTNQRFQFKSIQVMAALLGKC